MQFEPGVVLYAFGLTVFAGLCTGIGSILAVFTKKTNKRFLSFSLGFSAGVMIYVSMIEIFPEASEYLKKGFSDTRANSIAVAAFFSGIILIALIDRLVPAFDNPHAVKKVEDVCNMSNSKLKLCRIGTLTAVAVAVHNFPEGIATFTAVLNDFSIGIVITIAIAIHNIPEGVAVAVPIYYATGNRKKAFRYSLLSGLSEPLGALIGYLILSPFMTDTLFGIVFASVAGIMVFISIDELLPAAREYGEAHTSIYGFVVGMVVMAGSLILLK